jgi:hypothetical protein
MKIRVLHWLAVPLLLAGSVVVTVAGPASAVYVTCFHRGNLINSDSAFMTADWTGDGRYDECFGIAPDRTIWHDWSTSGGWVQMPDRDGRADVVLWWAVSSSGYRRVVVGVGTSSPDPWYQDFVPRKGWTGNWQHCVPSVC